MAAVTIGRKDGQRREVDHLMTREGVGALSRAIVVLVSSPAPGT